MNIWYAIVGGLFSGASIGSYLTYVTNARKITRDEFNHILETWKEDNDRLRTREEELTELVSALQDEVGQLKITIVQLRSEILVLKGEE